MLEQLLQYLHNWFRVRDNVDGKYHGTFTVEDGSVVLPFLQDGQYFRIMGSVFNDGLYIYGETIKNGDGADVALKDETFTGSIWALSVPRALVSLSKDIAAWNEKYGDAVASPFSSESFGGYNYTKATSANGSTNWQTVFAPSLNQWRKIRGD